MVSLIVHNRDISDDEAVGDFHREVVPILRRGNPDQVQIMLKNGMQEGQCSSALRQRVVLMTEHSSTGHYLNIPVWVQCGLLLVSGSCKIELLLWKWNMLDAYHFLTLLLPHLP